MNYSHIPYYERSILSLDEISNIKNLLNECDWTDGLKTAVNLSQETKKNSETTKSEHTSKINSIIMAALDRDIGFHKYCIPKSSKPCIVSKTGPGGYYHPHRDNGLNGDFSTTVFISDPSEYDGGELCLYFDGIEHKIKPKSGFAVTYKTGTLHRVNEVKSGYRIVCVLWTTTPIKDPLLRSVYLKITDVLGLFEEKNILEKYNKNFDDTLNDPIFHLKDVLQDIMRSSANNN